MRCNNCGYDNDANVSVCVKCGHQLSADTGYAPNYGGGANPMPRPTVIGARPGEEPVSRPTVVGAAGMTEPTPRPTRVMNNQEFDQQMGVAQVQGAKACPSCGYPVVDGFSICPSCGASMPNDKPVEVEERPAQLSKTVESKPEEGLDYVTTCDHCGKDISPTFQHCPYCGEKIHQKTVFVRHHKIDPPKPKCSLTIIPEEDEQIAANVNNYEGASVYLNRDNTEPNNRSITSKKQAELISEDGKWYLVNHSELCTTSVEANRKIEIQSGDIIILGDRRFKFEAE